ncbi:hypothetical protein SAMN05421786_11585 [Chryseobacterium ureilyticum]|uniref:Uncharacterized protein n=1 Tax=Chryseobacterium ureilyticum TaxID=373668 RepID=A0A1N7QSB2_9FLAO|nr:hypothetical protein [Chryseobacterium ureilyticum]SIT25782.1 hypothetical protein SAMN05421786_11585 [Chryseobacterium ureilyticum]
MRKVIIGALLVSFSLSYGQSALPGGNTGASYSSTLSIGSLGGDHPVFGVKSENAGRALRYEDIIGSPYHTTEFHLAKVADNYDKVTVRYNSYTDEVEYQKDGKPLVLPKEEQFSRIEIASPKSTMVLLETKDELSGYFFELVNGNNKLYKKVKTKFNDAVPAANSYASDKAAFFKTLDPVYYIKTPNGFIRKPKKDKDIFAFFPDKKEQIQQFLKTNSIKLNKEEDLVKLVNFLNQ